MTDTEKKQQKGVLLLEYQEAEEDLAHLREKAVTIARALSDVSMWLNDVSLMAHGGTSEEGISRDATVRANFEKYRLALNFDSIVSLMNKIKQALENLAELSER
jgi:hypothetical protein